MRLLHLGRALRGAVRDLLSHGACERVSVCERKRDHRRAGVCPSSSSFTALGFVWPGLAWLLSHTREAEPSAISLAGPENVLSALASLTNMGTLSLFNHRDVSLSLLTWYLSLWFDKHSLSLKL